MQRELPVRPCLQRYVYLSKWYNFVLNVTVVSELMIYDADVSQLKQYIAKMGNIVQSFNRCLNTATFINQPLQLLEILT